MQIDFMLAASGLQDARSPLMAAMHPKQRAFFSHPAKAKALIGGRQGGKTRGVAMWLVDGWERHPGRAALYATKTAKAAGRRCWPQIKTVCKSLGIRIKFNESDLIATFPNGYTIFSTGVKDKNECDKIRGEAAGFQKIAVDEPATFGDDLLEYLMTEVIEPTTLQTMGDVVLCGTPGPVPNGFWHAICTKLGWHVGTFTMFDNPFLPDPEAWLVEYLRKYGFTRSTPKVLREVFAQWVLDTEALVYLSDLDSFIENNGFFDLPTHHVPDFTTLGVDLGYSPDPCAFVVGSSWRHRRGIWIRRAYTVGELTPDKIAGEIRKLKKQYGVHRVLVDAGGGGKTTAMALSQSYGVHVEATPKGEKRPKIETMRGGIAAHDIHVHLTDAQELVSEWKTILWDETHSIHHELCADHCADGAIQACLPHAQFDRAFEPPPAPSPFSADKLAAFAEANARGEDELH